MDWFALGITISYGGEEKIGGEFEFQLQNDVELFKILQLKKGGLEEDEAYDSEENPRSSEGLSGAQDDTSG